MLLFFLEIEGRPKRVKIFLQIHAGKKQGATLYSTYVKPLFDAANVDYELTRESSPSPVKKINFS